MKISSRIVGLVVLSIVAVGISGCSKKRIPQPKYAAPTIGTVPATGLPQLSDVKVTSVDGVAHRFEATASSDYKLMDVLAVLYCRANHYLVEKGFDEWNAELVTEVSTNKPNSPHAVLAVLKLYKEPLPAGVKVIEKDWCEEMDTSS